MRKHEPLHTLITGIVAGVSPTAGLLLWMRRPRMVVAHRSHRSFEETCSAIAMNAPGPPGVECPHRHLKLLSSHEAFRKNGLVPERPSLR